MKRVSKNPDHHQTPPCNACGARCCKYVAIEIDRPTTKQDYDNIRWYLLHENIYVFVDHDKVWHLEFRTRCRDLGEDNSCQRYPIRPEICRKYGWPVGSCEFFASPYKVRFTSIEEFERYLDRKKIDWRFKKHRLTPQHPRSTIGT